MREKGCVVSPERRAYHEEHARTTKFIHAHMHGHDIKENVNVRRNEGKVNALVLSLLC